MGRPTQKDVALRAGVSRATVSYVIGDQSGLKISISPETRQRVMDAIAELGYAPDARAQALRRGTTNTIGVLFPIVDNPFYWELLLGMSTAAQAAGYSVQIAQHSEAPDHPDQGLRELMEQRADGYVLFGQTRLNMTAVLQQLYATRRPVTQILPVYESRIDHVVHGYAEGARLLMAHLLALGHRRIGLIYGVADPSLGVDRLQAYREMLDEHAIPFDETLIDHCGSASEDGYQAMKRLMSRADRPTAVLAINDLLAIAAIRAAADLGMRVPGDVSIAGFDDITIGSYVIPRLTTVSGESVQSGQNAVRQILNRLAEPDMPNQVVFAQNRLIVRESTGPVPTHFSAHQ